MPKALSALVWKRIPTMTFLPATASDVLPVEISIACSFLLAHPLAPHHSQVDSSESLTTTLSQGTLQLKAGALRVGRNVTVIRVITSNGRNVNVIARNGLVHACGYRQRRPRQNVPAELTPAAVPSARKRSITFGSQLPPAGYGVAANLRRVVQPSSTCGNGWTCG